MTEFEEHCAAAYRRERVTCRRLARSTGLSEAAALKQVLEKAAGTGPLGALIAARKLVKMELAARLALRRRQKAQLLARKKAEKLPDACAWLAWFDGSAHPNPGHIGIGGLLRSPDGRTLEISSAAGQGDSNQAEYLALIAVLEAAIQIQPQQLVVYGDSQVVINAVNTSGSTGTHGLQHHCQRARLLVSQLTAVRLEWIPRQKNAAADALSQQAISLRLARSDQS
ncbi:ribonuclease HI family protein [Herminiimonas sp. CN]|uniref:ribonuclease HI family protein n=1 Tax=Herminiimonas sp. CN TaxID=1349818 RepID=UPI000473CE69|nr:ribonuclease HI family protein [Herminiimonas sp. CN]